MNDKYFCIDLKSFYASCECSLRQLDPFKTPLVVCDNKKGCNGIVLAITPYLKSLGLQSRCRVNDIPKNLKVIYARPRMSEYIKFSNHIYSIYLEYVDSADIYVYSVDEVFLKVDSYLSYYKKSASELAKMILDKILLKTKMIACCGIGDNMLLSKYALDILAKKSKDNIAYLSVNLLKEKLYNHTPLTDFWQIGRKTCEKLHKLGLYTLKDISEVDYEKLERVFKKVATRQLYNQALGIDEVTISDLKNYIPKSRSLSYGQILPRKYNHIELITVLKEMVDTMSLELINKKMYCNTITIYIRYEYQVGRSASTRYTLDSYTNSYKKLIDKYIMIYKRIIEDFPIKQISICASNLTNTLKENYNLFSLLEEKKDNKEEDLYNTILDIKNKYGKNIINKAHSYLEEGTQIKRNKLIGGHNANG